MVKMAKDYYDILGIGKDASQDQIKSAYRELALKHHPDRNKHKDSEEKFKEINAAYAVLSDPEKRRQYDAYGSEGFEQRFTNEDIFKGVNIEDIIRGFQENMFGFQDVGNPFGGFQEEPRGVNLNISFEDIEKGFDREFSVQHNKMCSNCKGSGGEPGSKHIKCAKCNGKGRIHIQQQIPFTILTFDSTCDKCRGSGKIPEKVCKTCRGSGKVIVTEKFRIKVDKVDGKDGKSRGMFGIF
jgi:molecular chaperone DnaJ